MIKKALVILLAIPTLVMAWPLPRGYVSDFASVLGPQEQTLEHRLSEYHKQTHREIAVVTIDTLDGQPIESYAHDLFHHWGIGERGKDNGLLVLIVVKDHKTRIEVGYGLEGQLNDAECGRIIREQMIPEFRQNQFAQGVQRALNTIFERLK